MERKNKILKSIILKIPRIKNHKKQNLKDKKPEKHFICVTYQYKFIFSCQYRTFAPLVDLIFIRKVDDLHASTKKKLA